MDVKNREQALKLQEEFKARLLQTVETLRKGKAPSTEVISKDREKLLARAQARLDSAVKERETALRQWDERIARLKEDIQRFEAEAGEIDKRPPERPAGRPQPRNGAARKKTKG
jgi:hypothetical protein